jgi:hypothetical protein
MKKLYKCYFGEDCCIIFAVSADVALALAEIKMREEGKSTICTDIEIIDVN